MTAIPKQGVGLTYGHTEDAQNTNCCWYYNWSPTPPLRSGLEAVPMIWDEAHLNDTIGGNSSWVMGFNEPDQPSQANMTPTQGATYWRTLEARFPVGTKLLLSPAPSHLHPEWLSQMRSAYFGIYAEYPRFDAVAVHCYLPSYLQQTAYINARINEVAAWGVNQVWVTEFAIATADQAFNIAQMNSLQNYFHLQSRVARYAHFAARVQGNEGWPNTPLCDFTTGALTAYGTAYLTYQ